VGGERGGQVHVVAGLSAGERVALGDLSKLSDGTRIEISE